jgi:choline dehydrogenase
MPQIFDYIVVGAGSAGCVAASRLAAEHGFRVLPGAATISDDDLIEYMKRSTESNYHPVGTCRMGRVDDSSTVVGPDLRVKGVEGVRVLDASMMPRIISANTNATAMAVADKGVDLMIRHN